MVRRSKPTTCFTTMTSGNLRIAIVVSGLLALGISILLLTPERQQPVERARSFGQPGEATDADTTTARVATAGAIADGDEPAESPPTDKPAPVPTTHQWEGNFEPPLTALEPGSAEGTTLSLSVPGTDPIVLTINQATSVGNGRRIFLGHPGSPADGVFSLAVVDDSVAGMIRSYAGNAAIHVKPAHSGQLTFHRVDADSLGTCGTCMELKAARAPTPRDPEPFIR